MLHLGVACNDPDTGFFDHKAHYLQIGIAEFEPKRRPPRFVEVYDDDQMSIRLARKPWPVVHSREWVGNWCWNSYCIGKPRTKTPRWWLTDFVSWLRERNLYHCNAATSDFYNWFNNHRAVPLTEVHSMVCDLEELRSPTDQPGRA